MDVVVGVIFLGLLLLLVFCALQPGLETLRLEAQRQEVEARKLADIQAAGRAARFQVDTILARYGQMIDLALADDPSHRPDLSKVTIFIEQYNGRS